MDAQHGSAAADAADGSQTAPPGKPVAWLHRALELPGRARAGNEPGLIERIEWLGLELLVVE